MSKRCRHSNNSWLISRGHGMWLEWCYRCGAIRNLKVGPDLDLGGMTPVTEWLRPTGENGKNPCEMKPLVKP